MAYKDPNVKVPDEKKPGWIERQVAAILEFVDCHPRTGWIWFVLMIANTIINLLDLFH